MLTALTMIYSETKAIVISQVCLGVYAIQRRYDAMRSDNLTVPRYRLSTYFGRRAFSIAGLAVWNSPHRTVSATRLSAAAATSGNY